MRKLHFSAAILLLPLAASAQTFSLSSPDGSVKATISDVGGNLFYSLTRGGQSVINTSRLGLVIQQGAGSVDLGANLSSIAASSTSSFDQTYNVLGWHDTAENHYNTFTLSLNTGSLSDSVEFRAYNDGLAFRYDNVPGSGTTTVLGESTQWNLPTTVNSKNVTGWYQSGTNADYANAWVNNSVSTMAAASNLLGPVVMNYGAGNGYAAINESGDFGWTGMSYKGGGSNSIIANFPRVPAGQTGWQVASGVNSPWRTITTSPDLNGLVNSDMMSNTAPPPNPALYPQGVNTSWIQPGRAMWSFLDNFGGGSNAITPQNMEAYIDEAAKLGFEYTTIDSGWKNWSNFLHSGENAFDVMKDVTDYAHSKGVKIIAWKDSNDFYTYNAADPVSAPDGYNNGTFDTTAMQAFMQQLSAAGVDGMKIDALRSNDVNGNPKIVGEYQKMLNFMVATYEESALLHIVVDEHGAPKDSGANYTYPNGLTTEDVRGLESTASATHEATLPFTTLLGGPADYTPGLFSSDANPGKRGSTTWANQMAMGILITSPIIHWASGPQTISASMPDGSDQLQVFKDIPATWDETRVLAISDIGKIAAFARRKGNTWFLAMVNGSTTASLTENNIDLSFLGSGTYKAIMLGDDNLGGTDAFWDVTDVASLNASYDLDVTMRRGGGFVAEFTLIPEPTAIALIGMIALATMSRRRPRAQI